MEGTNFSWAFAMFRGTTDSWSLTDVYWHPPAAEEGVLHTLAAQGRLQRL
jgi:hypothetical protein